MFKSLKKLISVKQDHISVTVDEIIDVVVDESIHKIRLINGYRRKMRKPVENALSYCAELAERIPGTLDLSGKDPAASEIIGGFFKSPEEARTVVTESTDVRQFLNETDVDELYLLMTMNRRTKTVFDSGIQGQIVVRDIATKAYLFEEHKLVLPSDTLEGAYRAIRMALLKSLSHIALELTLERQRREVELEQLRDELDVKLKLIRDDHQQLAIDGNTEEGDSLYTDSQILLNEVERELEKVQTSGDHLTSYLNQVTKILSNPGQYLEVDLLPMKMNRIGVFVKDDSKKEEGNLCIAEFKFGDIESRSAVLIKCHRNQLKTG